jgi:predicted Zn-dependent peptidase
VSTTLLAPPAAWIATILTTALAQPTNAQDSPTKVPLAPPTAPVQASEELKSGAHLVLMQASELAADQRVEGLFLFRVGSVHEPAGRTGMIEILALALRSGGSVVYDGRSLDAWLTRHAVTLDLAAGPCGVELAFSCPEAKLGELFERISNLLTAPSYSDADIDAARQVVLERLDREQADPVALAERALRETAFGLTCAWARCATASDVRAVTKSEVRGFHRAHMGPGNLWIGLAVGGEVGPARAALDRMLATLPRAGQPIEPPPPAFQTSADSAIVLMDVPDVEQAELRVAFAAPADPAEATAVRAWIAALERSPGFDPALEQARTLCGPLSFQDLAPLRRIYPLGWAASGRAAIDQVPAATAALISAFSSDVRRELSADAFQAAATPQALAPRAALAERVRDAAFGITPEQRKQQEELAAKLTPDEVQRIVRLRLPVRPPVVVVVGPARRLVDQLESLGPVFVSSGVAEARGTPEGLALRARLLEAMGGADAWARMGGVSYSGTVTFRGSERAYKVKLWRDLIGHRLRQENEKSGVPTTVVVTPVAGWSHSIEAVYDLAPDQWDNLLFRERRQLVRVLHDLACDPRLEVRRTSDGRVEVHAGDESLCWIELDSLDRPVKLGYEKPDGEEEQFEYTGWIEEAGISWPMEVRQPDTGTIFHWKSVHGVPAVENSLFERPTR